MYAQATALVTIRRGTSTDGYGDTVDTGTAVATGVPMSILQQRRAVTVPADARVQQVAWHVGRCAGTGVDVQAGDQLQDEATGAAYAVDDVYRPPSAATTPDLTLALRRIT